MYVKVEWPESQKYMDLEGVEWGQDGCSLFVPEGLYNEINEEI